MALYLVETTSQFRIRYVIDTENPEKIKTEYMFDSDLQEFSQLHLGEEIQEITEISDEQFLEICNVDNSYLKNHWTEEHKRKTFIYRPFDEQ